MVKRMLMDATHPEETRVVVLDGTRLEEFDVETSTKRQLKGNIYLAKVVRVEPSLQAAFVDYGGNRHGFLAFGEIHPDYYQIPVADRQALIDEEERAARAAEVEADNRARHRAHRQSQSGRARDEIKSAVVGDQGEDHRENGEGTEAAHTIEPAEEAGEHSDSEVSAMAAASELMVSPAEDVGMLPPEEAHGETLPSPADWHEEAPLAEAEPAAEIEHEATSEFPTELAPMTVAAPIEPIPVGDEEPHTEASES